MPIAYLPSINSSTHASSWSLSQPLTSTSSSHLPPHSILACRYTWNATPRQLKYIPNTKQNTTLHQRANTHPHTHNWISHPPFKTLFTCSTKKLIYIHKNAHRKNPISALLTKFPYPQDTDQTVYIYNFFSCLRHIINNPIPLSSNDNNTTITYLFVREFRRLSSWARPRAWIPRY